MKISTKSELKNLIKECLIEILTEGVSTPKGKVRESLAERELRPEYTPAERVPMKKNLIPELPPSIPASMRSLFSDTAARVSGESFQENSQKLKQEQVLQQMGDTWSNLAYAGATPSRGLAPSLHKNVPDTYNSVQESDFDDGFDPYEVVNRHKQNIR